VADISVIFFLAGLAIVVTILHIFLKQANREEYAYLTLIVGLVIALLKILPLVQEFFAQIKAVFNFY